MPGAVITSVMFTGEAPAVEGLMYLGRLKAQEDPGLCLLRQASRPDPRDVLPRGLFNEDRPRLSRPVIVPTCKECNDRKGGDDSYVRQLFRPTGYHCRPDRPTNLDGQIARSIQKGHSQLVKPAIHWVGQLAPLHTDAGHLPGRRGRGSHPLEAGPDLGPTGLPRALLRPPEQEDPDHYEFEVLRITGQQARRGFEAFKDPADPRRRFGIVRGRAGRGDR